MDCTLRKLVPIEQMMLIGCLLSYLNQSGSSVVKNGTTVPADYLSILGGDFIQGCKPWDPTYNGARLGMLS